MDDRHATSLTAEEDSSPLVLELSVLGGFRAHVGGRELALETPKARALLAYLALDAGSERSRERLAGLFWSESEEARARSSLRQVVHKLREALRELDCEALQAERGALAILPGLVRIDVHEVLAAAQTGAPHRLLLGEGRLAERLLAGFEELDPAFRVWLQARRQSFQDALVRALEPLLEAPGASPDQRRNAAQSLMQLDPTHEAACRLMMRMASEAGDPGLALRLYEKLWRVLEDDFDIEPSLTTQALVTDIKMGRLAAPAVSPAPPGPGLAPANLRIALQVEAFGVHGVTSEHVHLVFGFRHDLIARLVRFREWFVVADGPAPGPGDHRVRSRYRIGATAYQAGSRISMVLVLVDQDSGIYVWSERVDLSLDTWFETQQHVLRRIAITLNTHISADRLARSAAQPDLPLEGYDSWLRCRHMLLGFHPSDWERAFGMAEEMARAVPNFAPAWCNLAQLDNVAHIIRPGTWRDPTREARALTHAKRAVQLDPTDCRNQLCLGWSYMMMGRYPVAASHMGLALELNPGDSMLLISLALHRAFAGEHAAARSLAEQSLAATLVPSRTHWGYEVTNAYLRGDDQAALEACDRAEDVILTLQAWRAAALHRLGRQREAEAAAARFLAMVAMAWCGAEAPTPPLMTRWLLHLYPIRRAEDWRQLRDGLAGAKLPTEGAAHGAWQAPWA